MFLYLKAQQGVENVAAALIGQFFPGGARLNTFYVAQSGWPHLLKLKAVLERHDSWCVEKGAKVHFTPQLYAQAFNTKCLHLMTSLILIC